MELLTFKTLWGYPDSQNIESLSLACQMAEDDGFNGIEGPVPANSLVRENLAGTLAQKKLHYIAEVCTAGSYVPDRNATVKDHLEDMQRQLQHLTPLKPLLVNCIGGCDRWCVNDSLAFFDRAMELADKCGVTISFETHRGRSLYSPWAAEEILGRSPLPLTCDFSHWCVVCEGMGESEDDLLKRMAGHALHIHGRIGYDQGPQVSDPRSRLYKTDLEKHLRWWRWIWDSQREKGETRSTLTPEFGPDGYQMVDPDTGSPEGDLAEINHWMAEKLKTEFAMQEERSHD